MGVPVSACDDLGRGAFGVGEDEEVLHLGDSGSSRAVGEEVVEESGSVLAAYSLDPDLVGTVVGLERVRERRPE